MSTDLLIQSHKATGHLLKAIKNCLAEPNLEAVRVAAAYARWDGIGLISEELEAHLSRGGKFEFIYGAGNGVTTPDSLLYGLYLEELHPGQVFSYMVEDKYCNSIFHPKLFDFQYRGKNVSIVGSGNFTGGGLLRNTELALQVQAARGTRFEKRVSFAWKELKKLAEPVTVKRVRELMQGERAGSERNPNDGLIGNRRKPALKVGPKVAPKPLFRKALKIKSNAKKSRVLSKLSSISERPSRLYLQIFANETGGNVGSAGYQVQLPVATLSAYFGVGIDETKSAEFRFPKETIETNLTHFDNHTHRVRLRPILDIPRPAILIFDRVDDDTYKVRPERRGRYAKTLAEKCVEQSRAGARKWGFE